MLLSKTNTTWQVSIIPRWKIQHWQGQRLTPKEIVVIKFGRGKGRCLLVHGESNRAKSFIFMPILKIYDTFLCPSDNKFNWVGANLKQVIFLNDLNYSKDTIMKWGPFLNLLEGAPVHISVPKNYFAEDALWTELTPIFATAAAPIVKISGGCIDQRQSKMTSNRWKTYHFTHEFTETIVTYYPCEFFLGEFVLETDI